MQRLVDQLCWLAILIGPILTAAPTLLTRRMGWHGGATGRELRCVAEEHVAVVKHR